MDFDLNDDRRMLSDSLTRWLADNYDLPERNKLAYDAPFHDDRKWADLAELGVLYALADEDHGGFGGAGFDVTTVFQALGSTLCPEPVLGALMCARLLMAADADTERLLTGQTKYALAVNELDAFYDPDEIETTAKGKGDDWQLTGRKSVVYGGQVADMLLVVARTGDGLGVFLVDATDVQITAYGMIDGGGAAEVFLDDTPAKRLLDDAAEAVREALDWGALALSAEALGAMEAANTLLLDYLRSRQQFGKPIGKFQALQHRAVDLTTAIEQSKSMIILAASKMGGAEQARHVAMCKHFVGEAAVKMAEETIQMHGGIAMTWEYAASHFAKRLVMIDAQLGDSDYHLKRMIADLQAV